MDLTPFETLRSYPQHNYTICSALLSRSHKRPDADCLVCEGRTWSWGEVADAVARLAAVLENRGLSAGDRVALMARNSEMHLFLLAAAARLGAIMVPVNPAFSVAEAAYVLADAAIAGLICDADTAAVASQACRERGLHPWVLNIDPGESGEPALAALLEGSAPREDPGAPSADDVCIIVYTSGTSGFPKGVMHSQRTFLLSGEVFVQRMHVQPDDRLMIVLPMFHINALFYSVSACIAAGCAAIIAGRFSASRFWALAAATGATEVNVIEAIGTILVNRPRTEYAPAHRICKAYGVRSAAAEVFRKEFSIHATISGYGMTEAPGVLSPPWEGPSKPGAMGVLGRHPDPDMPWAECRVLNDAGQDASPCEVGELAIRGPNLMRGYFRDERKTAESFADGWFLTGDRVYQDEDGWFFFVGRKHDIIRRRGENISGAELDLVIAAHPAVREAAAIAVPSELGEDDILVVVAAAPGASVGPEEIARWCAGRLSPAKVPRFYLFVDDLPHTPTHKVAKAVLRADKSLRLRAFDLQSLQT